MNLQLARYLLLVALPLLLSNCAEVTPQPVPTATLVKEMSTHVQPQQPVSPLLPDKPSEQVASTNGLLTYHGITSYPGTLEYEIDYDAALWQLIAIASPYVTPLYERQRLQNHQDPDCLIALYGGAMELDITGQIELAGRKWLLSARLVTDETTKQKQVTSFEYITDAKDPVAGNIGYFLAVFLPSPADLTVKSTCQEQAEAVFSTFRIGDSTQMEKMVRGYWETVEGQSAQVQVGKIYTHDWFAVGLYAASSVNITWGNRPDCSLIYGRLLSNEIHTRANIAETTFVFHDATHATVTFHEEQNTYVKHLIKIRDDPAPNCTNVYTMP